MTRYQAYSFPGDFGNYAIPLIRAWFGSWEIYIRGGLKSPSRERFCQISRVFLKDERFVVALAFTYKTNRDIIRDDMINCKIQQSGEKHRLDTSLAMTTSSIIPLSK